MGESLLAFLGQLVDKGFPGIIPYYKTTLEKDLKNPSGVLARNPERTNQFHGS